MMAAGTGRPPVSLPRLEGEAGALLLWDQFRPSARHPLCAGAIAHRASSLVGRQGPAQAGCPQAGHTPILTNVKGMN